MSTIVKIISKIVLGIVVLIIIVRIFVIFVLMKFNPIAQINCLSKGDDYQLVQEGGPDVGAKYYCIHTYSDGDKPCKSSDECEGDCLMTDETIVEKTGLLGSKITGGFGSCQKNDSPVYGCYPGTVEGDKIAYCF